MVGSCSAMFVIVVEPWQGINTYAVKLFIGIHLENELTWKLKKGPKPAKGKTSIYKPPTFQGFPC